MSNAKYDTTNTQQLIKNSPQKIYIFKTKKERQLLAARNDADALSAAMMAVRSLLVEHARPAVSEYPMKTNSIGMLNGKKGRKSQQEVLINRRLLGNATLSILKGRYLHVLSSFYFRSVISLALSQNDDGCGNFVMPCILLIENCKPLNSF